MSRIKIIYLHQREKQFKMAPPSLSKKIKFIVPKYGTKKYTAILPDGEHVSFGHRDYQHYKDSVPVDQGGGQWSHLDHLDNVRRKSYRARHGGLRCKDGRLCINIEYTPAWFAYHFLW